jgi:hypothetical protein
MGRTVEAFRRPNGELGHSLLIVAELVSAIAFTSVSLTLAISGFSRAA